MAKILYCSEAGNGYAYVEGPIYGCKAFKKAGHEVVLALRDLTRVERLVKGEMEVLQAPTSLAAPHNQYRFPMTFADLLHNMDFGDADRMLARVRAWRRIFETVKPDVLRMLHSPGALLAARGMGIKTMVVGTGFLVPPQVSPLPNLRPWEPKANPQAMAERESRVLGEFNKVLGKLGSAPLTRLSELWAADITELWCYPEMDEYGPREGVQYVGIYQPSGDARPVWPNGNGKRIFAYLDPVQSLPDMLEALKNTGCAVLAFVPHVPEELVKKYAGTNLAFAAQPLDVNVAARECDFGVSHGGHNIASTFLAAGKPQLAAPVFLPERIASNKLTQLGVGIAASPQAKEFAEGLNRLRAGETDMRAKAQTLAQRYSDYSVEKAIEWILKTFGDLTGASAKAGGKRAKS